MAKQRRASSRPVRPKSLPTPPQTVRREVASAPRPEYIEAVALYEQGVAALQAHEYSRASSVLRSVLSRFPAEKAVHERVRLYLNICDRHMAPRAASPSTPEERVFAATLALNAGNFPEALEHLRTASKEAPDDDHALYMLASVLALCDQAAAAIPLLLRAIELNADNRAMARHDPDLEPLRRYDTVRAALDATPPSKGDRRKTTRRR